MEIKKKEIEVYILELTKEERDTLESLLCHHVSPWDLSPRQAYVLDKLKGELLYE